jgi:hypothetical protein
VGVFAIRKIKKGTHLFREDNTEMVWIDKTRLRRVPKEIRRLYDDFAVIKRGRYGCPASFNCLTMAWYLNEPADRQSANVRCDPKTYEFYAENDIEPGTELTVNYDEFSEEPGNRKDASHGPKPERQESRRPSKRRRR